MVKLNSALASRKGSKSSRRSSCEPPLHFLRRTTHMYLQNAGITEIEDLSLCTNLTVLYLQNNMIEKIDNLHYAAKLTNLHLQNNKIKIIENLENMKNLRKLYLGNNCISATEGLEELGCLEELHIEKQKLPSGIQLNLNSLSASSLKNSLRTLVISGNGISSIESLLSLVKLQSLRAANNQLKDLPELLNALQTWRDLENLSLQGNPICTEIRYRERIITASYHTLGTLDGKPIQPITRSFLQSLALRQASRKIQPCSATRVNIHDIDGSSRSHSLQLAINSKYCTTLPDLPSQSEQDPFCGRFFPAWASGKCLSAKGSNSDQKNWDSSSRRKSCDSASTDLSQHLQISRL